MSGMSGKLQPIIIRRVRKGGHASRHGGQWKIAYADFVTAMMAFFLLMWLLGSTAQGDLQGIALYFQSPLKVALAGGPGSGEATSVIKGGGNDLTRSYGNVKRGENDSPTRNANLQALRAEVEAADATRLRRVQARLEQALQNNPSLASLRQQIRMDMTSDGLRIQIVDDQGRPMFDTGSAKVKDYMRELLRSIGRMVDEADAQLYLSGHTDATPYSGGQGGYSNWELSADRANASRRELLAGGLGEERVVRVLGLGSSAPFDAKDPFSPLNRRISILVLGQLGRERWQSGAEMPVTDSQALERILARREGKLPAAPASTPKPPSPGATP
jgi:chemotaxis protein MotB